MKLTVMQDVAHLFVEQYEDLIEDYKKADVDLIRKASDGGAEAIYAVIADLFGSALDKAFLGAAQSGMDYIAYTDETWETMPIEQQMISAELQELHLESVKTIWDLAQSKRSAAAKEIAATYEEAKGHVRHLSGDEQE